MSIREAQHFVQMIKHRKIESVYRCCINKNIGDFTLNKRAKNLYQGDNITLTIVSDNRNGYFIIKQNSFLIGILPLEEVKDFPRVSVQNEKQDEIKIGDALNGYYLLTLKKE